MTKGQKTEFDGSTFGYFLLDAPHLTLIFGTPLLAVVALLAGLIRLLSGPIAPNSLAAQNAAWFSTVVAKMSFIEFGSVAAGLLLCAGGTALVYMSQGAMLRTKAWNLHTF